MSTGDATLFEPARDDRPVEGDGVELGDGFDVLLRCEGISVSFGETVVLDDVSLKVRRGEVHVLIGPNGAGKTTLANVVTGHVNPSSGSVSFAGRILTGPTWWRVRSGVGRKFQVPRVFPRLTTRQNLSIANRQSEFADIDEQLREVGKVTGASLSHGWRQWLELQMVLAQDPPLVVLDEPTAGLARADRTDLAETIASHRARTTFLVVEHDMDFVAQIADRVSFMHEGRVLRTGGFDEISADPKIRGTYLGSDAA